MAIAVNGLVSGIDSASIVSKLVELEKAPVTLIENKITKGTDQLTAWQELNTKIKTFQSAAEKINVSSKFLGTKGTFTNDVASGPNIVSIATTTNAVASATYNFTVTTLATQHKMVSAQGYNSLTDSLSNGGITITKGGQSTTFNQNTLNDLQSAINASGMGLTASIIDTTGTAGTRQYKLQIASNTAGAANAFTVSSVAGETPLGPAPAVDFTTAIQGRDASVTIDGITVTRPTNTFTDILPGVSMQALATGTGKISFTSDTDAVVANISDFVKTYNDVIDYTVQQSTYNKDNAAQKPLFGNSTMLGIQQSLRNAVSGTILGIASTQNQWSTLSQVGLKTDNTNMLSVDTTVLTQALKSNVNGVKNLFTSGGSGTYTFVAANGSTVGGIYDTAVTGGAIQMRNHDLGGAWITLTQSGNYFDAPAGSALEGLTIRADAASLREGATGTMTLWVGAAERAATKANYFTEYSTSGPIFNARKSLEQRNTDYQKQIDDMNQRIKKKQDDLTAKYARLETTLSKIKGTGDYLSQQLNYLPQMATKKK